MVKAFNQRCINTIRILKGNDLLSKFCFSHFPNFQTFAGSNLILKPARLRFLPSLLYLTLPYSVFPSAKFILCSVEFLFHSFLCTAYILLLLIKRQANTLYDMLCCTAPICDVSVDSNKSTVCCLISTEQQTQRYKPRVT